MICGASIFTVLLALYLVVPNAKATDYSWGEARLLTSERVDVETYGVFTSCGGGVIDTIHNRSDNHDYTACVFGGVGSLRIARHVSSQGLYVYAVSPAHSHDFYKLVGPCDGTHSCAYSQTMDMLMAPTYLNPWSRGMGIYSDVKKHLKRRINVAPTYVYYELSYGTQPFQAHINGLPAMVESGAFAMGGPWAILEARWYGVLLVNLETFQTRRIKAPGADYGLGHDPAFEMAISDDGKTLAVTGMRAGVELYNIDESCGDEVGNTIERNYSPLVTPCANAGFDTANLVPNLYAGHFPSFSSDGSRIRLVTHLGDGSMWRISVGVMASDSSLSYLALGDSFSSGQGEDSDARYLPFTNDPPHVCHVGRDAYPFVVATNLQLVLESVACSGAQTVDVVGTGTYNGQGGRLAGYNTLQRRQLTEAAVDTFRPGVIRQQEFVEKYRPPFITIGIGGNDAGLMSRINSCLGFDTCEWAQNPVMRAASAREIAAISGSLRSALGALKRSSPQSKIYVIGYPEIISEQEVCRGVIGSLLNKEERHYFNVSIRYLNDVVASAATSEGLTYVDMTTAFYGERLCEGGSKAMNGIRYGDDIAPVREVSGMKVIGSESFHPTPYGHSLLARRVLEACNTSPGACDGTKGASGRVTATPTRDDQNTSGRDNLMSDDNALRLFYLDASRAVAIGTDSVTLRLPEDLFVGGSTYSVEVSSEKTTYTGSVPDDDVLEITISLSPNHNDGFRTIHVRGIGEEGSIDAYAVVAGQIAAGEYIDMVGNEEASKGGVSSVGERALMSPFAINEMEKKGDTDIDVSGVGATRSPLYVMSASLGWQSTLPTVTQKGRGDVDRPMATYLWLVKAIAIIGVLCILSFMAWHALTRRSE